jgi:uncharacterized membrane protein
LSQILVLSGKCESALHHILSLRDVLRSHKIKMDKEYTLPALGVLSLLPISADIIARDILEAQAFLKAQKGFGVFSVTSQELLLYAAAFITTSYAEDTDNNLMTASVSTSITSILIAQQIAILIAASASASAAAAAAASS